MKQLSKTCKICNKIFDKKQSDSMKYWFVRQTCSRQCSNKLMSIKPSPLKGRKLYHLRGKNAIQWKGGKRIVKGYLYIYQPTHLFSTKQGYVRKHRLVSEKYLGRYLKPEEQIHHIDANKLNNRVTNLYVFPSNSAHWSYEITKNKPKLKTNLIKRIPA